LSGRRQKLTSSKQTAGLAWEKILNNNWLIFAAMLNPKAKPVAFRNNTCLLGVGDVA
jgi:hypothetical protein